MVSATIDQNEKMQALNTNTSLAYSPSQSLSATKITPESNHIALEVSELKAQIRKLKQQM